LRFASVLASLLFVATFAFNGLTRVAQTSLAAAPVPAYGIGGGGGPSTPEQPLQSFAAPAPTESLEGASTTTPQDLGAPTAEARLEAAPKEAPPSTSIAPGAQTAQQARVPAAWQLTLGTAAVLCGCLAWYVHQRARRNFRARWLEK